MKITYKISLLNSSREVVKEIEGEAKSLVKNHYLAFYIALTGTAVSLKDVNGASFTPLVSYSRSYEPPKLGPVDIKAPEGDSSYGILIGTSDVSPSADDTDLHQKFSCHPLSSILSDVYLEGDNPAIHVVREFENDNEDTIIKEFGIIAKTFVQYDDIRKHLIFRDVVTPIAFPLDYSLRVKVKFSF